MMIECLGLVDLRRDRIIINHNVYGEIQTLCSIQTLTFAYYG